MGKTTPSVEKHAGFLGVGFGNSLSLHRIVAVIHPKSATAKRIRDEAKDDTLLIDVSMGRKVRSLVIMDTGHIVLSTVNPETLVGRTEVDTEKE